MNLSQYNKDGMYTSVRPEPRGSRPSNTAGLTNHESQDKWWIEAKYVLVVEYPLQDEQIFDVFTFNSLDEAEKYCNINLTWTLATILFKSWEV